MAIDDTILMNYMLYIIGAGAVLMLVLFALIINLFMKLSYMKKRYKKMMTGVDDGANLERLLLGHIDEMQNIAKRTAKVEAENKAIRSLVNKSLHKVGLVRFCAFEDIGSDLSYAVALLDEENSGMIFSSIFGRDESRTYVKPVVNGTSTYTLTDEEKQALQQAMQ